MRNLSNESEIFIRIKETKSERRKRIICDGKIAEPNVETNIIDDEKLIIA